MSVVDERAVEQLVCVKGDPAHPCAGRPIVRYAVGPVCSSHQIAGAQVYEWFIHPALADAARAALAHPDKPLFQDFALPDPGRAKAAQHADADPGEANAARLVAYKAGKIRARVLDHLTAAGPRGTTAIEAWHWYQATYSPDIERYSVAPRLSEMVGDGWAVKTGELRNVRGAGYPPEEVYVLSARGRRERGVTW